MGNYTEFYAPAGLRARGTVIIMPGRGETQGVYTRLGKRLAADAYEVRIVDAPRIDAKDVAGGLARAAHELTVAATGTAPVRPLILLGADIGALTIAALAARGEVSAPWWPDALVLAAPPGRTIGGTNGWDDELDVRTSCPAHRAVLSEDPDVVRGCLAVPVPEELIEAAYRGVVDIPHLVLVGDADPLADREALVRTVKAAPSARLSIVHGAHHDVLNDLQHRSVAAEIVSFFEILRTKLVPIILVESSAW